MKPRITVLGVGNILRCDEGIGVHMAHYLMTHYTFSENVRIVEGGTLGMRLLSTIIDCDRLIVLDTVLMGADPGTVVRLEKHHWQNRITSKASMHEVSFTETLCVAQTFHTLPETIIIGMAPADMTSLSVGLSEAVRRSCGRMADTACLEIKYAGGVVLTQPPTAENFDWSNWAESALTLN
jgi:hydrogenase maturation protease